MAEWSNPKEALHKISEAKHPYWSNYYGFYSSWLGGYFKEPWSMLIPLDDHMVHRGDGVFEAVRLIDRAYFDLDAHLSRLQRSADQLGLQLPFEISKIKATCVELARMTGEPNGLLRIFVSRGPGDFGTNPYTTVGSQLNVALTKITPPSQEQYKNGVRAFFSSTLAKEPPYSGIKSCNYLQNVLMKKESVDRGFDFALSQDASGRICEGSTENFAVITKDDYLVAPKFDYTLRGTTLLCALDLAKQMVRSGDLKGIEMRDLRKEDLGHVKEMAFIGTTLGVLPVRELEGVFANKNASHPIFSKLGHLLDLEMRTGLSRRTAI